MRRFRQCERHDRSGTDKEYNRMRGTARISYASMHALFAQAAGKLVSRLQCTQQVQHRLNSPIVVHIELCPPCLHHAIRPA